MSSAGQPDPAAVEWDLWSTRARLVVTEPTSLEPARAVVERVLRDVDDAANRFRSDSDLRRLPSDGGPAAVSPTLAGLLRDALWAAELTDGDVDPTVGTAMRRLGYDRDLRLVQEGSGEVRAVIAPVPGYRSVSLVGRRLRLPAGVELDLGATAKAAAADHAAARVHEDLGTGVLVSLGGDIATAGEAPPGGWQIHVQDRAEDPVARIALPAGAAVATSSTVSRQWTRGRRTLHHVVDPRTGQPAPPVWRSVTVAADTCLRANAVTTACLVRGASALEWVRGLGLPGRFLDRDGRVVTTDGWPRSAAA